MQQAQAVVGIDLGDRYSYLHVLEPKNGDTVGAERLVTTQAAFKDHFESLPVSRVVIEAGVHSPWVSHLLETLGHEVIVTNPTQSR